MFKIIKKILKIKNTKIYPLQKNIPFYIYSYECVDNKYIIVFK